jgi:hypothetical protein
MRKQVVSPTNGAGVIGQSQAKERSWTLISAHMQKSTQNGSKT